jgi:hypothetical protein
MAAEVAQSGVATWHRLGEVVTMLGARLGPQVVHCATLFRALRTACWWRWDAEEGHEDPS